MRSSSLWLVPATILAFASAGPLSRIALGEYDPFAVVAVRSSVAALLLAFLLRTKLGTVLRALGARERASLFSSGIAFSLHLALFVAGLRLARFVTVMTLISLEPCAVVAAGVLFFRARPAPGQLAGIALSSLGAGLLATAGGSATLAAPDETTGVVCTLLSVVCYGAYYALNRSLKARATNTETSLACASLLYAVAAAVALAVRLVVPHAWRVTWRWPSPSVAAALVALGVLPTCVGHTLYQIASRRLSAPWVAITAPGETLGAIAIGLVLFGAVPTLTEMAGGLAVVLGTTLVGIFERDRGVSTRSPVPPPS